MIPPCSHVLTRGLLRCRRLRGLLLSSSDPHSRADCFDTNRRRPILTPPARTRAQSVSIWNHAEQKKEETSSPYSRADCFLTYVSRQDLRPPTRTHALKSLLNFGPSPGYYGDINLTECCPCEKSRLLGYFIGFGQWSLPLYRVRTSCDFTQASGSHQTSFLSATL